MTQNASDVEIANQGFAAFRQDLNDVLEDITTLHSGDTAPSTTYANQWWYETDTDKLYIRNEDNDAWIEILTLDQANDHLATLGASITLDGTGNVSIDSGDFTVDTDTLHADSTNNRVGIGTTSPTNPLTVSSSSELVAKFASTDETSGIDIADDTSYARITNSDGLFRIDANDDGGGSSTVFSVATAGTERMRIASDGSVGIGTSSPSADLTVTDGASGGTLSIGDNAAGSTAVRYLQFGESSDYSIQSNANSYMRFYAEGSERMRILSSGNVGTQHDLFTGRVDGVSYTSGEHQVGCFGGGASDFVIAKGCSVADTDVALWIAAGGSSRIKLQADGNGRFDGSADIGSADYAEMFEWDDGNTSNEDRVGYSVVLTNGNKIRKATSSDAASDIIGIISGRPGVVGDNNHFGWHGKWQTDDYMRRTMQDITVYSWTDENGEDQQYRHDSLPDGVTVPDDAQSVVRQEAVVSSNYDDTLEYAPREDRQEWDAVGMMGKVRLRAGQPTGDRWIKMRDIATDSDGNVTVEEWLVR